jgi:hypothetical protein
MAEEVQYSEIERLDARREWNARVMMAIDRQDEYGLLVDGHDAEGDAGFLLQCEFNRMSESLRVAECCIAAMTKVAEKKREVAVELETKYKLAMLRGDSLQRRVDMVEAKFAELIVSGVNLIATERKRQVEAEGWTAAHDDSFHKTGELASAAGCYVDLAAYQASNTGYAPDTRKPMGWPWSKEWWKPSVDPIRNLVKAGALIVAEIDRLTRKKVSQ